MITAHRIGQADASVAPAGDLRNVGADAVWLDAVAPTPDELADLERLAGFSLPTWDDMSELELSSRLYRENGALVMIAHFLPASESRALPTRPVAFILQKERLITIRRDVFASFERMAGLAYAPEIEDCRTPLGMLCRILEEAVSDRADSMEFVIRVLDELAVQLFSLPGLNRQGDQPDTPDLKDTLKRIGATGEILSNIRESMASIQRMLHFLKAHIPPERLGDQAASIDSADRDITALSDEAAFLMNRLAFYLDATLGMINIEENQTVKILSAVALIFCPPMLVASIYGMNFAFMPELRWPHGYFLALAVIAATVVAQVWWLKKRKWF